MSDLVNQIIDDYISDDPERERAHHMDPQAHFQTEVNRRTLTAVDRALCSEGLPPQARLRVLNYVVWGNVEGRRDQHREALLHRAACVHEGPSVI